MGRLTGNVNAVHSSRVAARRAIREEGPGAKTGARDRRRAARRAAITREARRLVFEVGVDAFTLRQLAEASGAALGAVYRYFPSKDALLAALQIEVLVELSVHLQAVWASAEATALGAGVEAGEARLTALWTIVLAYVELDLAAPRSARLIATLVGDPRRLIADSEAMLVMASATTLLAGLGERLDATAEAGGLAPGVGIERATVLWATIQGALALGKFARVTEGLDARHLARLAARDLVLGWGAPVAAFDSARARAAGLERPIMTDDDGAAAPDGEDP
jgi:AcrR family transcriptional regulator